MTQRNRVSQALTGEQLQAIRDSITAIRTTLADVLKFNLSPEERIRMLKMGDKTIAFVAKTVEYARQNPELLPAYLDADELEKDYQLSRSLYEVYQQLSVLTLAVEDSLMVAGSEAYDASLIFYNSVKGASRSAVPATQAIYQDLKLRFPRRSKSEAAAPETPGQ